VGGAGRAVPTVSDVADGVRRCQRCPAGVLLGAGQIDNIVVDLQGRECERRQGRHA
jgi:hypothetical protein